MLPPPPAEKLQNFFGVFLQFQIGVDTQGCMYKRNRHLVDHSGVCVCYLTKDSGGTTYTVRYARAHGLEIINLAYR